MFTIWEQHNLCFEKLISLKHDFNKIPSEINDISQGYRVVVFGQSKLTKVRISNFRNSMNVEIML